jgi:hypothetical protein
MNAIEKLFVFIEKNEICYNEKDDIHYYIKKAKEEQKIGVSFKQVKKLLEYLNIYGDFAGLQQKIKEVEDYVNFLQNKAPSMREFMFRAYDLNKQIMVYDFDQTLVEHYPNLKWGDSIHSLIYDIGLQYRTLMQYTGQKDIENKKIFEKDIVETTEGVFIVNWNNEMSAFFINSFNYAEFIQLTKDNILEFNIKIKRNIYEDR